MAETAAVLTLTESTWRASAPHVRKALAFLKRKGAVTADELVAWDRDHGRRLFNWDDSSAANDWRRHQARLFLNSFRAVFEGMRVRAYIHVHEDEEAGIGASEYVNIEAIAQHPGMRAQVIDDITRRMKMLASELKMWKLTPKERDDLFARLAEAMMEEAA
jgi:hypothetical protein